MDITKKEKRESEKKSITDELKELFKRTAEVLKGSARRIFMAQVIVLLGKGGQRQAERELGWNRGTIRTGQQELESGKPYEDNFSARGRKPVEEHLPNLLDDIKAIADSQSQTDPSFQTTRLYLRLSVAEIRRQLIAQKGYTDEELPCEETIRLKLNKLGYYPKKVKKCTPIKKIPETDAIFEKLHEINAEADADESQLRISMDAKATVLLGNFSREGYSRIEVKALDHDFRSDEKVTPFGIFLPQYNKAFIFLTNSAVTADFMVDCLRDVWLTIQEDFTQVQSIVLNLDNGPENNSRRTQFMQRMSEFVDEFQLTIQLAYYPPYHSKYNPVERVWGALENFWSGDLLDSIDTVKHFAQNMTYNGIHPIVQVVKQSYQKGIKLTQKVMAELENRFLRLPRLEDWFVLIQPLA